MKTYVDEYYQALSQSMKNSFRRFYGLDFEKMNGNIMVAIDSLGGLADAGLMSYTNFMLSLETKSIIFNPCRVVSVPGQLQVLRDCDDDTLVFEYPMQYCPGYSYKFKENPIELPADSLVPAVVYGKGSVLMVGAVNREALELTKESGRATFYSRTRREIWVKGEGSGNLISVDMIRYNPAGDGAIIYETNAPPESVCHRGKGSCFTHDDALTAMFA